MKPVLTLAFLAALTYMSLSQAAWRAVITTDDAPFARQCDGAEPLDNHEMVFIYLDGDEDGPDTTDRQPNCVWIPGAICFPEDTFYNMRNFPLSSDGTIHSPLFQALGYANPLGDTLRFYMRIFAGGDSNSMYTSPIILLPAGAETTLVTIPFTSWACGYADVPRPVCHGSRFTIELGWPETPTAVCFTSCTGGLIELVVGRQLNPFRPPAIRYTSGCDSLCDIAVAPVQKPEEWFYYMIFGVRWYGSARLLDAGCVTAELLDSIPIARLDTLTVTVFGQSTLLEWNTSWESGLVSWQLWQPRPWGNYDHHLADIPAADNPQGTTYSFALLDAMQHGTDITYILVMVAADSQKYGAAYISSSQFLRAEPRPAPIVEQMSLSVAPNPFNASTTLRLYLQRPASAGITITDLLGRHVTTLHHGMLETGEHRFTFDGSNLPSGIYFARVQAGEFVQTQKLLLLK